MHKPVIKRNVLNPFKKLAGDTAIYGISSIVGRFVNWWLMPLYVGVFAPDVYGIVTNLYSYVAFFMVMLTYGLETGFFRFASTASQPDKVYTTTLTSIGFTSALFLILVLFARETIAGWIEYESNPEYIAWLAIILAIDALTAIPYARLRLKNRPLRFAFIRLVNIGVNISCNIFFLLLCPWLDPQGETVLSFIYSPDIGVGYVFISNLIASLVTLVMFLPDFFKVRLQVDLKQLKTILLYSFPILIVGITGVANQHIDKILIPFLIPEEQNPMEQLGIYGAGVKIAVLMNMFIQAFRYAFEPFFFSRAKGSDDKIMHAGIMKYFVIFGLFIFLGMVLFIDLVKFIILNPEYHKGFKVVPIILMGNLFLGVYFALSMWYKLTDKTRFGAYISSVGSVLTIVLNFALIPVYGYMGSAFALMCSFFLMMVVSYFLGQKYYPIPYDLKRLFTYALITGGLYSVTFLSADLNPLFKYPMHILLMTLYLLSVLWLEKNDLKRLFKTNKKN